jgi:hypothetical protein
VVELIKTGSFRGGPHAKIINTGFC